MQIKVVGRHMDVSPAIHEYAVEKISKSARIHDRDEMILEVVLHVEKNPSNKNRDVAEVTAHMKGFVVRAEEAAPDMYAAIDLVSEKLERQMSKYKARLKDRRSGKAVVKTVPGNELPPPFPDETEEDLQEGNVVRTKNVNVKPMTEDEAIMQMELLGHDFFVFLHAERSAVNVLYRRNDGDYGLIETGV